MTLDQIIEDTLSNLYRTTERPFVTYIGTTGLTNETTQQCTLSDPAAVHRGMVLEIGYELVLVTDKSDDADPVFTLSRGYAGSTAESGHETLTPVLVDPAWPRSELARWVQRFFQTFMNTWLPSITSEVMQRVPGMQYIDMPADTIRVLSVRHISNITGRIVDIGTWQFEEDLPDEIAPTGKLLRISAGIYDADELIVTYQVPYSWTGTGGAATIQVPLGSEDLPSLWCSAYGLARREVSRSELDKVEEWNQEQAIRQGVNLRLVREMWGEFYRRLDEARRVQYVPKTRPYRKMARMP